MKYTLLKVVQNVLSSMDSDEVESIDETTESEQIVDVCEDVFYELLETDEWPHNQRIINIDAVSDSDNPTAFILQDNVKYIWDIKYDVSNEDDDSKEYKALEYLRPEEFLHKVHQRRTSNDNVEVVEPYSLAEIFIINDKAPQFWTSFDDEMIVFDSYDSAVDDWVQNNKVVAMGEVIPTFKKEDSWVVELPINMHPLYLAECKATAYFYFRQQVNQKDEQKILRNRARLRHHKSRTGIDFYDQTARKDFGRRDTGRAKHPTLGRR